jgi:hypothetical protein
MKGSKKFNSPIESKDIYNETMINYENIFLNDSVKNIQPMKNQAMIDRIMCDNDRTMIVRSGQ